MSYFLGYGYGSAKILDIGQNLTELECYVYIDQNQSTELQQPLVTSSLSSFSFIIKLSKRNLNISI